MPEARRESVDVTALLRNILDNYPAGSAVIREFLQNTDDCGATTQTFILDTRTSSSDALVDPTLASCQGPAIIAVNDGYFLEKDWTAITQIHTSSKKSDETSTGKYGLGFRSSYHVTDNPQILSGDTLLILDPHQRVKRFPGGFELRTNNDDRRAYRNHFDTFKAVLPPNATRYEGTAIRLPLRVNASQSKIKTTATGIDSARQMFQDFMSKDLGECMLFLKHITKVKLIEIGDDNQEKVLGCSWIDNTNNVVRLRSQDRGRKAEISPYELTINIKVGEKESTPSRWIVTQFVEEYNVAQNHLEKRLGRSSLALDMTTEKLLPHIALAFPITDLNSNSSDFTGRLFTLLPLPIFTGFPLHINAVLALTSSRQNLRSAGDAVRGSREEFLVEWNKVVFAELVPKAWAAMLKYVVARPRTIDVFTAWPRPSGSAEGDRMYWQPLPDRLLEEAGPMVVWPVQLGPPQSTPIYHKLLDILVSSQQSNALISILKKCSVPIITPPASVHGLIQQSTSYRSQLLRPAAVHPFLKQNVSAFSTLEGTAVKSITEYLTTGGEISLLYDLPLFINCKGGYTTLLTTETYTLATDQEASLFQDADPDLLKLDVVSQKTQGLLRRAHYEQIHPIRGIDVAQYLSRLFGSLQSETATVSTGVKVTDTAWLVRFWTWVGSRPPGTSLFTRAVAETLFELFMIPLDAPPTQPRLCKLSRGVMDGRVLDPGLRDVLRALEVPMLHPEVPISGQTQNLLTKQDHVIFILENVASHTSLDQTASRNLNSFLIDRLSTIHRSGKALTPAHRTTLRSLPIFPLLSSGPRPKPPQSSAQTFGVAPESSLFVDDSVQVVPSIDGRPFIDGREGAILAQVLGKAIGGEVDVLKMVLQSINWAQQANVEHLSDLLIDRVLRRMNDFDEENRTRIAELPIVVVGASGVRVKPSMVIDPKSKIASLYDADDGVLPHGHFADSSPGTLLHQLRSFDMLRSRLDEATIIEVVTRLGDQTAPFLPRERKALLLLPLLNKYTSMNTMSPELQAALQNYAWLPANGKMYRSSECWDNRRSDFELCDFVLPFVLKLVISPNLRDTLGWTRVPLNVLRAQLVAVMDSAPRYPLLSQNPPSKRIISILRELFKRFHAEEINANDLTEVVDALGNRPWVPVGVDSCRRPQHTMLRYIELGTRFQRAHSILLEQAGLADMLMLMGICDRPSPSALLAELHSIAEEFNQPNGEGPPTSDLASDSVAILHEISRRTSEFDLADVLVLDEHEEMRPIRTVVFNDRGSDHGKAPADSFFAHPTISRSLARALEMRQLSEEELDQDEDDIETFHMVEELATRVKNTLKGYDIEYASNEWVANADDANATTIKFILHEGTFPGNILLGPEMKQFQEVPSLVIFNSGVFSEKDFKGIRNIGIGGKSDAPDAIGRFGLGAFSFYHFTDVLMIVSGDSVLFLDPSESYLPRKKGEKKRTGVKMTLAFCRVRYPDQLKPLDGISGYDISMDNYEGTLFRLPLRTPVQAKENKLSNRSFTAFDLAKYLQSYFRAATQSMFFSKMQNISALRRAPGGAMSTLWSVDGSRTTPELEQDGPQPELELELNIRDSNKVKWQEKWLVCTSRHKREEFPEEVQPLFVQHRLPPPVTGIALNIHSEGSTFKDPNFRLFATLPLPVSTSLPAHVHAAWILSDDRRSLRYDLADGKRRTLDSAYNKHILQSLIPPLYLRAIAIVCSRNPLEAGQSWPRRPTDPVSQAVSSALYGSLKDTEERVLGTVSGEVVAPKNALISHGPRAVGSVLGALQLKELVRRVPFDEDVFKKWDALRTDSPKEVASLLRARAKDVRKFYESDSAQAAADINDILKYLLGTGKEVNLVGVPLLQVGDSNITSFKSPSEPKIFCTKSRSEVGSLFGRENIIGSAISREIADTLCTMELNVRNLEVNGLRELLRRCAPYVVPRDEAVVTEEFRPWYPKLLAFLTSPASPVKLEALADLPLIPVSDGKVSISFNRACQPSVWWQSHDDHDIIPILRQCGIPIVQFPGSHSFRTHTHNVDLPGVLGILSSPGIRLRLSQQQVATSREWAVFADWIKLRLTASEVLRLNASQFDTLIHLPLFLGQQGQTPVDFTSASDTSMLPLQVTTTDITRYLPSHLIFSPFSPPLQATLARLGSDRTLTIHGVIGQLELPDILSEDEEDSLRSVINLIWQHRRGIYRLPLVPDENRKLRVPSELYDPDVDVFRQLFHNRPEAFVHPNFRDLVDRLAPLGVHQVVTPEDIMSCAIAIDRDSRTAGMNTRARAEFLWHFINEDFNAARRLDLNAIRNLRFIPARRQRHFIDPELSRYSQIQLPSVVSVAELCLAEHAPTVWTQRATFDEAPSAVTRAIFQELGMPTIQELVDHLVSLTTSAAIKQPGSKALLSDLRDTYEAIRKKSTLAEPLLLRHRNQQIWLNVDDPETEDWVWRSAAQLDIGLRYESAHFSDAKAFLRPYTMMLIGAGAKATQYATLPPSQRSSHAEKLLAGWQSLRNEGALFDIQLVVDGEPIIKAHRGLLAAVSSHFKEEFTRPRESTDVGDMNHEYPVDDELPVYRVTSGICTFAVRSGVDFVYTGNFLPPSSKTPEESDRALEVLLDLLKLANNWHLDDLKILVIEVIVDLQLVRADTYKNILGRIQSWNVPQLVKICRLNKTANNWA